MITLGLALLMFGAQTGPGSPCPEVGYPRDDWGSIRNSVASGGFTLQTQEGNTDCRFTGVGMGQCFVFGPARFRVKSNDAETYFSVPDRLGANIQIADGAYTCRLSRVVRTD